MLEPVLLALAGAGDRVRGGYPEGRPTWIGILAAYGAYTCIAATLCDDWRFILAAGAGAGVWNSWPIRHDAGWRGDWTRGRSNIMGAARWGALWALPYLALAWWVTGYRYLAVAPAGAVLAIWIATKLPPARVLDLRHAWPWSELITLPIIGSMALALRAGVQEFL